MKTMMLSMNLIMLISPFLKHPISLGSMLFTQSLFTALLIMFMTKNSWFSFILFITFTGGLMIMFIYMSSIASNEKFKFSMKMVLLMIPITLMMMIFSIDKNFLFTNKWMEMKFYFQENEEKLSILKFLNSNKKILSILMITIILLTLIAVTNIVNSFEGPLKKTYENIYS
nr:NADH dehydrogenase subunit 6 [Cixiidae sp.]